MRRRLRPVVLLFAAALQIVAPLSAYAHAARLSLASDLCSAASVAARPATTHDVPTPARHHCAQSLCCIGVATGAGASPRVSVSAFLAKRANAALPAAPTSAAHARIILAARPRGPPFLA